MNDFKKLQTKHIKIKSSVLPCMSIKSVSMEGYEPNEQVFPYLLAKKSSEFKPEVIHHQLVDGKQNIQMASLSECYRECSLASQLNLVNNPAVQGDKNFLLEHFSCMSFTYCHPGLGYPASCQLSSKILSNSTQSLNIFKQNSQCNVFQINPLAQFHVVQNVKWKNNDRSKKLYSEIQPNEQACAVKCLALGAICRSFTAEATESKSETLEVICQYFSVYNYFLSTEGKFDTQYIRQMNSNIYTSK